MNKTREMLRIETEHEGRHIADILRDEINQNGARQAAENLRISEATRSSWCREFGIRTQRRAVVI